jgi:hypothetical protein
MKTILWAALTANGNYAQSSPEHPPKKEALLGHGLVDELIFNVAPVLEGKGLNLLLDKGHYQYKDVKLLDFKSLGGGVVQLHFAVGRE